MAGIPPSARLSLCFRLLEAADGGAPLRERYALVLRPLIELLPRTPKDERYYWISTFYTLLMNDEQRRQNATYFTPPPIVRHLIGCMEREGLDLATARILDPAAGGAAFMSSLAGRMVELGCRPKDIRSRLRGIEIDPALAALAEALVGGSFLEKYCNEKSGKMLRVADALETRGTELYDAVFMNPPFGRILGLAGKIPDTWSTVVEPGHVNKYALFIALALRLVKPGGLVGMVSPSSYVAGPMFDRLRKHIRTTCDVVRIDLLEREDVFYGVQQDACVAVVRKRATARSAAGGFVAKCGRIEKGWLVTDLGWVWAPERDLGGPWILPSGLGGADDALFHMCPARLSDYGVRVKTGYFVWNRERKRLRRITRNGELRVPLFWAKNVSAGRRCLPAARNGKGVEYVTFDHDSSAIVRSKAVVLQRTTNNKQPRRLIAAMVPASVVKKYGGFVTENHTILVLANRKDADLDLVCRLLNSEAVDRRYRRVGGTASISVASLRELPLPKPEHLRAAAGRYTDFEQAVEEAYRMSCGAAAGMEAAAA